MDISSSFGYPSVRERQDSYEYYGSVSFYCSSSSATSYKWEVAQLKAVCSSLMLVVFAASVLLLLMQSCSRSLLTL